MKNFLLLTALLCYWQIGCFAGTTHHHKIHAHIKNKTTKHIKKNTFSDQAEVQAFIDHMVETYHFKKRYLIQLFNQVKINRYVLKKEKIPYQKQMSWQTYHNVFINKSHIKNGTLFWLKHKKVLDIVEKQYKVPAEIIVTIIGIESNYGKNTGKFIAFDALANIAFKIKRRHEYFQKELQELLLWARENNIKVRSILSSRDGGIGLPQFMPDSVRQYVVNFDHKGTIDLYHNINDVIASTANYLHEHGWKIDEPMMAPLPTYKNRLPLIHLSSGEIIPTYGLPKRNILTQHTKTGIKHWVTLNNFSVLLTYNQSPYYAMVTHELSNILANRMKIHNSAPIF